MFLLVCKIQCIVQTNAALTVLSKLKDKLIYDDVQFPVSFDDIIDFGNKNEFGVVVYGLDNNNIVREYHGNIGSLLNDTIYLIRIENANTSHYIYIKHIDRLLHKIQMFVVLIKSFGHSARK